MVFWFSGTGNSQYVAREIARETGERLVSIADALNGRHDNLHGVDIVRPGGTLSFALEPGERVGFVFPVYFFGVPTIVADFIARLELTGYRDNYIYGVCTRGGDSGAMWKMLRRKLSACGLGLSAGFEVAMPDNYILMFNLLTPPDKAARMLADAGTSITLAKGAIINREPRRQKGGPGRWLKTALAYPLYKFGRKTSPFHATADCTGCGLCAKVCPCRMISIEDCIPHWKEGRCTQCLACLHHCPEHAVQYGRKTATRGRYVNPDIAREYMNSTH